MRTTSAPTLERELHRLAEQAALQPAAWRHQRQESADRQEGLHHLED